MRVMNKQLGLAMVLALGLVGTGVASATPINPYVVKLTQQGTKVVASGSGEFDLSGLGFFAGGISNPTDSMAPSFGLLFTGEGSYDFYEGLSGPGSFGSGNTMDPNAENGDRIGVFGGHSFYVPAGYSSGTALTSGATWDNANFATLGVTPGTYTWTWGSAADQSFTLDAVEAVPEPAELGMFGLGLLLIGGFIGLRGRGGRRSNKAALS